MAQQFDNPIDLLNSVKKTEEIRYPKGTSKEYTERINQEYEKAIPLLKEKGYDVDSFNQEVIEKHLDDFFTNYHKDRDEINKGLKLDEINKFWEANYKPVFGALMTSLDKFYNDDFIKKAPYGYND